MQVRHVLSGLPWLNPSPYSPIPCGGASAMRTTILLAFCLHWRLLHSAMAAVTASGPSPPPEAYRLFRNALTSPTSEVKFWTRVRYETSCGGWSRYAMTASCSAEGVGSACDEEISWQIASMFCVADAICCQFQKYARMVGN